MYRTWILACLLALLPLLVYSNTILAEYGLRDDYSILREAREEPGKVLQGCGAQARPLYGILLEQSFRRLDGIAGLSRGRMAAALLLGLTVATAALVLTRLLGWSLPAAGAAAALLALLPSAQVLVSWSICWPFTLATFLATAAFAATHHSWKTWPGRTGWVWLVFAHLMLVAASLIYPPQALLFLVFVAAALPSHREVPTASRVTIVGRDLVLLGSALAVAFIFAEFLFFVNAFPTSPRIAFEQHGWDKLRWIATNPLKDALGLFSLDDYYGRTESIEQVSIYVVVAAIATGGWLEFRRHGWRGGIFWAVGLVVLSLAALAITFIAAERWAPYRTLYALSGVLLIFALRGFFGVVEQTSTRWIQRYAAPAVVAIGVILAAVQARKQTWNLIAVPQMEELRLVREGAAQIDPVIDERVFVIRPAEVDEPSAIVFDDEFGSLSTNSDWTPAEMIRDLMKERTQTLSTAPAHMVISTGWFLPKDQKWNVVIDLKHSLGRVVTEERETATARGGSALTGSVLHSASPQAGLH